MKATACSIHPLVRRHRASFLLCVLLLALSPTLSSALVFTEDRGNEHEDASYPKEAEDSAELSRNPKESKVSSVGEGNKEPMVKSVEDQRGGQATKAVEENSPALRRFLDDVLKAQDDLKWIDQTVGNVDRGKDWQKMNDHRHGDRLREKRDSDENYEATWRNRDASRFPRRGHLDNDVTFKGDIDESDSLASRNGMRGTEVRSSRLYEGASNDEIPKDWTKTKDLCSLSDWLNWKKSPGNDQGKSGVRWVRDREPDENGGPDKEASAKAAIAFNARNQRDETRRKEAPSLESLKETILELKKSLNAADKRRVENSKNVDAAKVRGKDGDGDEQKGGTSRARNKYRKNENDDETGSGRREGSLAEKLDLKKREQGLEDLDEKNARPKVWRTKRTEVNNDDGNPKLFRRVGFGEPYLEENALKEPHDRKRRSKGTPSDEKRRLNEAPDKNANAEEKYSMKVSGTSDRASNPEKKESPASDSRGTNVLDGESKLTNSPGDAANSVTSMGSKVEWRNPETAGNCEESDLSRENLNAMGNELTGKKGKGESPGGNSLQTFESMTNELQAASSATETSSQENVGSSKGEQVIKVFEPQRHLHENSERTKEVRRTEPDEEHGKLSGQLVQGKRSTGESGNINILLKSENKNLVKFSNACGRDGKLVDDRSPFVLNVYDVKKKMILEDEDEPGKSVSTIYNMKFEKARVDTPVKGGKRREEGGDDGSISNGVLDFERNKVKEVPYEDTPGSANIMKEGKVDEKRLKNFIDSDKGSEQSGVNEDGTRNWFEGAARNQMGMNVDHGAAENCNELGGKEKFTDAEGGRFNDEKGDFGQDSNNKAETNGEKDDGRNKKKYRQIFIMADGMDDRIMSDGYGQRRILQYVEYSNDDVEDVDLNYNDREEDDNQRRASIDKDEAPTRRKERDAYSDKKRAKVNLLIKQKLDRKKKPSRAREKRDPNVIAYYDYDSDLEQQDREALSPTIEGEGRKNNYRDKNAAEESDTGFVENEESNQACIPVLERKDEHDEEMEKELKRKEKFGAPKAHFLSPSTTINATTKSSRSASSQTKVAFAEEEGSSGHHGIAGSRSNEPVAENEERFLDSDANKMVPDTGKLIVKVKENFDAGTIDDFLEDVQSQDEKREKIAEKVEPLYEELKKIYDWNEDETKMKPRIKGDQRMYYGANDKLDSNGNMAGWRKDQVERPEIRVGPAATSASSPNLLPLLLIYNGSGKSEIGERTYQAVSSGPLESPAASNVTRSNYFALKSTDDMFKGGSEQSNSTEEKLRGPSAIGTAAEWQTQKVSGVRNDAGEGKDAASWSLTGQRQYIDTDSRSPYENRKYLESEFPRGRGPVRNIEAEKQTVISSRDLHESFVEPLEWLDDFDKDIRVRLGRGLKTIQTKTTAYVESATNNYAKYLVNASIETVPLANGAPPGSDDSKLALVAASPFQAQSFFPKDARAKREATYPYDAFYHDSERTDYNRGARNEDMDEDHPSFRSYDDDVGRKFPGSNDLEDYDYSEDDKEDYKVVRNASPKRKKHAGKKKRREKSKKKTRKSGGTSGKSRRKRRHRKKHSDNSKTKDKKHKKHASKKERSRHANIKKSKVAENGEKGEEGRKGRGDKVEGDDTTDSDTRGRRISSLLMTDDMEDESQMDSALHGELAGRIVEQIFDQVQNNRDLKVSLGPGLYQKHRTRDTVEMDKSYRQVVNDDEVRHAEELLNKIMLLVNRLIFDEVQRRTCISLPPDLAEFFDWMLDASPGTSLMEQPPTLPLVYEAEGRDYFPRDKFLFQSFPNGELEREVDELYAKIRLIKNLIKEYSSLEEKDKAKIESVEDYLAKQLDLLLEYIVAKEEAEKKGKSSSPIGGAPNEQSGSVLRYRIGASNASNASNTSNASYSPQPDAFSTLMNAPNLLKLSNANLFADEELLRENSVHLPYRGQRIIRSLGKHSRRNKMRGRGKKRKRKHGKHYKGASTIDQPRQRDTVHKAAALRQKREYLDRAFWDSSDSGYEKPLIYDSVDMANVGLNGDRDNAVLAKRNSGNAAGKNARSGAEGTTSDVKKSRKVEEKVDEKVDEKVGQKEDAETGVDGDSLEDGEEPITGKNRAEDEILLLNKRQAWRKENEEQLEEVAFGEDMRKGTKEKELFEKLTEIDKKNGEQDEGREGNCGAKDGARNGRNNSCNLSNEDELRLLERKINVYADNE